MSRTVITSQDEEAFESIFPAGSPGSDCRLFRLPQVHDRRGNLTFVEGGREVPFDIERVYYLYDVPSGAERAGHAHLALQQLLIAASGSFDVLLDNGTERITVSLNRPDIGLFMSSMVWREIDNFSGGGVCLVLANSRYDEADYIRDYDEFIRVAHSGK